MNITLRDLLRWSESPLYATSLVATTLADREAALLHPDRSLSWPVTMRATPPMLPHVESGAIVLLAGPTLAEVRPFLPGAMHELRRRGASALVIDPSEMLGIGTDDLDLLRARGGVAPDLEMTLTRLINERRSRLYRRGTEIDRALTEATLRGRGVADLLRIGATQSGRPLLLLDDRGRVQEGCVPPGESAPPRPPAPPQGVDLALVPVPDPLQGNEWLLVPLDGDARGWLALSGPRGGLDEVDRLLASRVAASCALALAQTRRARSRLAPARRAALVSELLRPGLAPDERVSRVETLGLDPVAGFAVLALVPRRDTGDASRALLAARRTIVARIAPHTEYDEFTDEGSGLTGVLLHTARPETLPRAAQALRAGFGTNGAGGAAVSEVVVALSAPVDDAGRLPELARQARYGLFVLRAGGVPGPFVDWSSVDDLGPYGLLYPLWGTPEAERFVAGILGDLPEHDARYGGELLATLLSYLRQGGAAGAAATELAIHRNTLTYRLRRIEEICKRSPLDPHHQLAMHLAALLHTLPAPEA
ncbi:MAG: hypothetical protein AVDCRST_MAG18-3872 [uncultured Thermomicrobiales bacterium]|uniref:PucR C-terminal helix-turn-helix domain-containing protein n=1 Tax=uncultured Thermomicrobiales bacterium TaxID=1645740 RepID=A0A6J4VRQ1_9BACT|nr:MAG: hypothetical protein AVDCRST_MAG18-3872 [uncultured Thermomicrobiales bacterium]